MIHVALPRVGLPFTRLMSLPGVLVLLVIVAAFAAVFWFALKDEHNRGRQN
jgi:uncharacterized membrane protein